MAHGAEDDKRFIFQAAAQAQRAVSYLHDLRLACQIAA